MNSTVEFSFLLNSCLDIFEIRQKQTSVDQDLGLLHAVDEKLAAYGWLTTTGVKLLVIIDLIGQSVPNSIEKQKGFPRTGSKDPDLKPVSLVWDGLCRICFSWFQHVKAKINNELLGFPSLADSLYPAFAKPVLFSR